MEMKFNVLKKKLEVLGIDNGIYVPGQYNNLICPEVFFILYLTLILFCVVFFKVECFLKNQELFKLKIKLAKGSVFMHWKVLNVILLYFLQILMLFETLGKFLIRLQKGGVFIHWKVLNVFLLFYSHCPQFYSFVIFSFQIDFKKIRFGQ